MTYHAAVWLDHKEAHVFHLTSDTFDEKTIVALEPNKRLHHRGHLDSGKKSEDNKSYYHEIATALADAKEVLVIGPSTAKLEFIRHVHKHDHELEPRIIGIETVDHPSDRQIVAYARKYFMAADKML